MTLFALRLGFSEVPSRPRAFGVCVLGGITQGAAMARLGSESHVTSEGYTVASGGGHGE